MGFDIHYSKHNISKFVLELWPNFDIFPCMQLIVRTPNLIASHCAALQNIILEFMGVLVFYWAAHMLDNFSITTDYGATVSGA